MRRLAAGTTVIGLGAMSSASLLLCGVTGVGLKGRIVLFLGGLCLFVAGGARSAMRPTPTTASGR